MNRKLHMIIVPKKITLYVLIGFTLILVLVLFNRYRGSVMTWSSSQSNNIEAVGKVAIIIDDFGNPEGGSKEMLDIEIPITCAIMPFLTATKEHAVLAHEKGHEVIIHMPMEPHQGNPQWLGEKGITSRMSTEEIQSIIQEAIEDVPHATGLNNHMGSKITEDKRIMAAIISVLKDNNMYIVDSKTSMNSVVKEVADQYGVPVLERSIFIDNDKELYQIKRQLKQLATIALKKNRAIGIGHVGPEGGLVTVRAIADMRKEIENMGIKFVVASQLLVN